MCGGGAGEGTEQRSVALGGVATTREKVMTGLVNAEGLAQPIVVFGLTKSDICGNTVEPNGPCAAELNNNASEVVSYI